MQAQTQQNPSSKNCACKIDTKCPPYDEGVFSLLTGMPRWGQLWRCPTCVGTAKLFPLVGSKRKAKNEETNRATGSPPSTPLPGGRGRPHVEGAGSGGGWGQREVAVVPGIWETHLLLGLSRPLLHVANYLRDGKSALAISLLVPWKYESKMLVIVFPLPTPVLNACKDPAGDEGMTQPSLAAQP